MHNIPTPTNVKQSTPTCYSNSAKMNCEFNSPATPPPPQLQHFSMYLRNVRQTTCRQRQEERLCSQVVPQHYRQTTFSVPSLPHPLPHFTSTSNLGEYQRNAWSLGTTQHTQTSYTNHSIVYSVNVLHLEEKRLHKNCAANG